jgi:uncharacterized protein YeaO (DUF488 family)
MLYTGRKFDKAPGRTKIEITRTRNSPFAPSLQLLDDYKTSAIPWETFESRYMQEMRDLYAQDPTPFHTLIDRAAREDVILTCWEKGDESTVRCHRRSLKDFLVHLAHRRGLEIDGSLMRRSDSPGGPAPRSPAASPPP